MLLEAWRYGFETMWLDPSVLIAVQATNAQALAAI